MCFLCLCAYSHLSDQKLSFALLRQSTFPMFLMGTFMSNNLHSPQIIALSEPEIFTTKNQVDLYSLLLSSRFYHNKQTCTHIMTYTHTQWVHSINVKYCTVYEFISFYLVNSNFQQYQKLLHSKKHTWNKLISTNSL
jgi:hypothetical protein